MSDRKIDNWVRAEMQRMALELEKSVLQGTGNYQTYADNPVGTTFTADSLRELQDKWNELQKTDMLVRINYTPGNRQQLFRGLMDAGVDFHAALGMGCISGIELWEKPELELGVIELVFRSGKTEKIRVTGWGLHD